MKFNYRTSPEVCSESIDVEISDDERIVSVHFNGGCPGSLCAVSKLVVGKTIQEAAEMLSGIRCGAKATSCPDQLSKALRLHTMKKHSAGQ